jgi:hypothetical protein
MDGIDLNELPFDLNNANNEEESVEVIDGSPDPEFIANLDNPEADIASATGIGLPSGNGHEDGINPNEQPELLYNPEEPYIGMKFDSLPHARNTTMITLIGLGSPSRPIQIEEMLSQKNWRSNNLCVTSTKSQQLMKFP